MQQEQLFSLSPNQPSPLLQRQRRWPEGSLITSGFRGPKDREVRTHGIAGFALGQDVSATTWPLGRMDSGTIWRSDEAPHAGTRFVRSVGVASESTPEIARSRLKTSIADTDSGPGPRREK